MQLPKGKTNQKEHILKQKLKQVKRKIFEESSSLLEEEVPYDDSSSDIYENSSDENELSTLSINDYIICKVFGKKSGRHYVAQTKEKDTIGYNVKFLKRHITSRFSHAEQLEALISFEDVVAKLP